MHDTNEYCIILTTCPSQEEANTMAASLIQKHLAACVQITGITSFYEWNNTLNNDNELLLLIKSKTSHYESIEAFIRKNHSYEVPEIVQIPIMKGSSAYLGWINGCCRKQPIKE